MQLCRIIYYSLAALHVSSDIFAHHQEHLNCITASGIIHVCRCQLAATYVCNTRSCNTVQMLLMMSKNIARNMQSSQGIINYHTQLHLVGHFRILCRDAWKHEYQVHTNIDNGKVTCLNRFTSFGLLFTKVSVKHFREDSCCLPWIVIISHRIHVPFIPAEFNFIQLHMLIKFRREYEYFNNIY